MGWSKSYYQGPSYSDSFMNEALSAIIEIDLGTTKSLVSYEADGQAHLIPEVRGQFRNAVIKLIFLLYRHT